MLGEATSLCNRFISGSETFAIIGCVNIEWQPKRRCIMINAIRAG